MTPYDGYKVYGPYFHKKEGRWFVQLYKSRTDRTTVSLARYRMSLHLGRYLESYEQVDHIDDDKTNDDLSNLQLLSPKQNVQKASKGRAIVELVCPWCGKKFNREPRQIQTKNPCCSRSCSGKFQHMKIR